MKTIIAGSRHIVDIEPVWNAVRDSNFWVTEVVSGAAKGVDALGEQYGEFHKIPVTRFPADWDTHGRAAGPIRNEIMALYAEALILVWDGESRGSANMKMNAERYGLRIYEVIL